jgi:hypothetical protein
MDDVILGTVPDPVECNFCEYFPEDYDAGITRDAYLCHLFENECEHDNNWQSCELDKKKGWRIQRKQQLAAATAAERERCARVAENIKPAPDAIWTCIPRLIATAIRKGENDDV